ncbi:MAG: DUF1993 domain-containing protein [Alphaproteobacteria bacterium]
MQPVMYRATVPTFLMMLSNLSAILKKAAAHAEARKIDPAVLVNARLYPDMFPLSKQVQIGADFAKRAAARLAGVKPPSYEDNETTFDELQARIAKTVDFINSLKPEQFAGAESRKVDVPMRSETRTMGGATYLFDYALPNFYFHLTTAYDILRHNGVELGKGDYVKAPASE